MGADLLRQRLMLTRDGFNSLIHISKAGVIIGAFAGQQLFHAGKQAGFFRHVLKLDQRFKSSGKQVVFVQLAARQGVMFCAGAELQHFSAEACRIVSNRQTNQISGAGIGKAGVNFH